MVEGYKMEEMEQKSDERVSPKALDVCLLSYNDLHFGLSFHCPLSSHDLDHGSCLDILYNTFYVFDHYL